MLNCLNIVCIISFNRRHSRSSPILCPPRFEIVPFIANVHHFHSKHVPYNKKDKKEKVTIDISLEGDIYKIIHFLFTVELLHFLQIYKRSLSKLCQK